VLRRRRPGRVRLVRAPDLERLHPARLTTPPGQGWRPSAAHHWML
jgi:hypothetical protein